MSRLMMIVMTPTKTTTMNIVDTTPQMTIRGIPIHPRMSPTLPHGSPGTDIVRVFCADVAGLVNATNVQGVGP